MKRNCCLWLLIISVVFTAHLSQGCGSAYMRNRLNDALDIVDLGITVTPRAEPQFAFFFDFYNFLPLGYADVQGKILGLGNRQLGYLDYEIQAWGVLAWGQKKHGTGKFNPADPHQARINQHGLTERQKYDAGFIGSFAGKNPPPELWFVDCGPRIIHLGWIGLMETSRWADLIDFILGWTTLDILRDDLEK
ncbi:MAG: hypothetical protein FJ117_22105 [Deltaproteobacteria bacterium]|nr:hypothetical protein [Deltaproteobacteria bacterium]